ncbi:MAG: hypothetical protein ACHQ4G_02780 [Opitutales bacterium]
MNLTINVGVSIEPFGEGRIVKGRAGAVDELGGGRRTGQRKEAKEAEGKELFHDVLWVWQTGKLAPDAGGASGEGDSGANFRP